MHGNAEPVDRRLLVTSFTTQVFASSKFLRAIMYDLR